MGARGNFQAIDPLSCTGASLNAYRSPGSTLADVAGRMTAELLTTPHARQHPFDGDPAERFFGGLVRHYALRPDHRSLRPRPLDEPGVLRALRRGRAARRTRSGRTDVARDEAGAGPRAALAASRARPPGGRIGSRSPAGTARRSCLEFSVLPLSDRADEAGLYAVIARPELPRAPLASSLPRGSGCEAALLASSPDAIVMVDAQGLLRYANRAVERLIGRTPAELVGRPAALLCGGARDLDAVLSALDAGEERRRARSHAAPGRRQPGRGRRRRLAGRARRGPCRMG